MGLDAKALEAVRKYNFKPGLKDGQMPVPLLIYLEVNFCCGHWRIRVRLSVPSCHYLTWDDPRVLAVGAASAPMGGKSARCGVRDGFSKDRTRGTSRRPGALLVMPPLLRCVSPGPLTRGGPPARTGPVPPGGSGPCGRFDASEMNPAPGNSQWFELIPTTPRRRCGGHTAASQRLPRLHPCFRFRTAGGYPAF